MVRVWNTFSKHVAIYEDYLLKELQQKQLVKCISTEEIDRRYKFYEEYGYRWWW